MYIIPPINAFIGNLVEKDSPMMFDATKSNRSLIVMTRYIDMSCMPFSVVKLRILSFFNKLQKNSACCCSCCCSCCSCCCSCCSCCCCSCCCSCCSCCCCSKRSGKIGCQLPFSRSISIFCPKIVNTILSAVGLRAVPKDTRLFSGISLEFAKNLQKLIKLNII